MFNPLAPYSANTRSQQGAPTGRTPANPLAGMNSLAANPLLNAGLAMLGASQARPGHSPYINPITAGLGGLQQAAQTQTLQDRTKLAERGVGIQEKAYGLDKQKIETELGQLNALKQLGITLAQDPLTPEHERQSWFNLGLTGDTKFLPEDKRTTLMQNLEAAGYVPGTKAYENAMIEGVLKPETSIVFPGNESLWDVPVEEKDLVRYQNAEGVAPPYAMSRRQLKDQGYTLKGSAKPEGERKAEQISRDLKDAESMVNSVLANPEFDPSSIKESMLGMTDLTSTNEYKRYKSTSDEWATNIVFMRSGATARQEEKDSTFRNFFPGVNNNEQTKLMKAIFRKKKTSSAYQAAIGTNRTTNEIANAEIDRLNKETSELINKYNLLYPGEPLPNVPAIGDEPEIPINTVTKNNGVYYPKTIMDMDQIPIGEKFINPSDGQPYIKQNNG